MSWSEVKKIRNLRKQNHAFFHGETVRFMSVTSVSYVTQFYLHSVVMFRNSLRM